MITVVVYINERPILARSARRVAGGPGTDCEYHVDDGSTIQHHYDAGAVALAKKLLNTIKEP